MDGLMTFRSDKKKAEYLRAYNTYESRWPVEYKSRLIETKPFGSTYVRISGAEGSPPIILLPAAHSNSLIWLPCVAELSRHFRVYAIDPIYTHGKSILQSKVSTVSELLNWIDILLDGLDLKAINLCGISLGGWISAQYALARPEKIKRLALLAPAATFLRIRPEFLFRGIIASTVPLKKAAESFNEWLLNIGGVRHANHAAMNGPFNTLMYASAKAYKIPAFYPVPSVLSDADLKNISRLGPLVIIGAHDQMYSVERAIERIDRVAPGIKVQTLPNAGHAFLRSHSHEVTGRLLDFLK